MNVDVPSYKKNSALVAIIIIDLMFLVWSCESESGKVAKQFNGKSKTEIVRATSPQAHFS